MINTLLATSLILAAPQLGGGPPVCDAGGPYFAECQGLQTFIQLDGSNSFDPDGTALTFKWISECPLVTFQNATSSTPTAVVTHAAGVPVCADSCIGNVGLEVSSGGEMSACSFDITVTDTLPPMITCPPDVTAVWGIDTTPNGTGFATAIDICDLNPAVTWTDTIVGGVICSGFEQYIHREWTATDLCDNSSTCTQIISLLSPIGCGGGGMTNLEFDPSTCVNEFDPTVLNGVFKATVMGTNAFNVSSIERSSIQLIRTDVGLASVQALRPWAGRQGDYIKAQSSTASECSTYGKDGMNEVVFQFRRKEVALGLGLDSIPVGTEVPLAVTGFLKDGSAFWITDTLVIK